MNYLDIVLQGYFNENNREYLEKYFYREFKNAEKEQFFEADEFFNGCLKVIADWGKYLQREVFKRKKELYFMLESAEKGELQYNDMEGKTIEQKWQETIEFCKQELEDVRPDGIGCLSFSVNLYSLTNGKIAYKMAYDELLQIKLSILKALEKAQTNIELIPPQHIENELSIPDWAIIFYYKDETGQRKGSKMARFKKFISAKKIHTTPAYFKKEYYEMFNRINKKDGYQQLPPERIEKILPYLKNNKKTMERAKNDIDYLMNEIRLDKEKDY